MALYHFINPGLPKILPHCHNKECNEKVIDGVYKYVCTKCEDEYTLCQKCYDNNNLKNKDARHPHRLVQKLVRQPKRHMKAERRYLIEKHLQLLLHSLSCESEETCTIFKNNCVKMKELLNHYKECEDQAQCVKCARFITLINEHAKICKNSNCRVPKCKYLREKFRLKLLEQHQMEDRRRAAQNQTIGYRPEANYNDDYDENPSSVSLQKNSSNMSLSGLARKGGA